MAKFYGEKVQLPAYPARFPDIQAERKDGGYQIEILVPMADAKAVQDVLYADNEKLINFNKASEKAKAPKKLWSPVYLYDEEAKEAVLDEDGEKVESDTEVVFRFKSKFKPQIQFKKGLDKTALIGAGSLVKIVASVFSTDEKKDEKGNTLKYTLLSLQGVRVDSIVAPKSGGSVFSEDDEYEDDEYEDDVESEDNDGYEDAEETETEEKPKAKPKAKAKGKRQF